MLLDPGHVLWIRPFGVEQRVVREETVSLGNRDDGPLRFCECLVDPVDPPAVESLLLEFVEVLDIRLNLLEAVVPFLQPRV